MRLGLPERTAIEAGIYNRAKTIREIQTKLLCYAYHQAPVAWRKEFLADLVEKKSRK